MKKVIVIGGGPAGMMAAIEASKKCKVILLEGNEKLGKKLYITGKGRCNVTNAKDISEFFDYIPGNPHFLYSSLYGFTNTDTMDFFTRQGIKLKVERGDRVFPESDKSSDIINGLIKALHSNGVDIRLKSKVEKLIKKENVVTAAILENGDTVQGDCFVISTGGKSYPLTGSTGAGFLFAKSLGHTVTPLKPSLVPIEIEEKWISQLQGLSLKNVKVDVLKDSKSIFSDFGEMLFTHFGVSGPLILTASRVVVAGSKLKLSIDLKPSLTNEELDKRIQRDFLEFKNKDLKNSLNLLLPQKIIPIVIMLSDIPDTKKINSITREERKRLVDIIKSLTLSIKGLRPIDEAIVTAGGINTLEIDPSTMKSKICSNVYFAGEVIDIDAFTGGYNVQIALSTGFLAGRSICESN
ncbi:NAD(P)/FAD-dependent oxidoreductase [Clostridium oryzae]|uniref:Dihydrolipoamide dehydrogenase n=1 Tax=Clostridium oryzae TaxID=1450648 RepID=A0A1V4IBL3_9CLOT|nr:NAD(P)/FAD-dependent oxidoreductase [Clostridium oryzae]OPJ57388.1 dihydrolipoamide dehydrogenase [Clostridium oryzae]